MYVRLKNHDLFSIVGNKLVTIRVVSNELVTIKALSMLRKLIASSSVLLAGTQLPSLRV